MPAVTQLQLRRLGDALGGHIGWPEGLRDHDFRVRQLLLEHRIGAVLIGGHDQRVAGVLEKFAKPELARNAAQQLARLEVDRLRRRQRLAVGILVDLGDVIARIVFRISVDGIVVENTYDLCHVLLPLSWMLKRKCPIGNSKFLSAGANRRRILVDRYSELRRIFGHFLVRPISRMF